MGIDYLNCDNCGEGFNDCEPYSICEGCNRSYCVYCKNDIYLVIDTEGVIISCKYCKIQEQFKKEIKKYPEIIIDSGLVIYNSDYFEIKFKLGELESYTIKDNKFKFKLINNNTEGSIFLRKKIFNL